MRSNAEECGAMQNDAELGLCPRFLALTALTRGGDSDDSTTTSSRRIGSHRVLISVATMFSMSAADSGSSTGSICP